MVVQVADDFKLNAVMRLWDTGLDTQQMATVLQMGQEEVERVLHIGLEKRHRQREESK